MIELFKYSTNIDVSIDFRFSNEPERACNVDTRMRVFELFLCVCYFILFFVFFFTFFFPFFLFSFVRRNFISLFFSPFPAVPEKF